VVTTVFQILLRISGGRVSRRDASMPSVAWAGLVLFVGLVAFDFLLVDLGAALTGALRLTIVANISVKLSFGL